MSDNRTDLILEKANEFVIDEWTYTGLVAVSTEVLLKALSTTKSNCLKSLQIVNSNAQATEISILDGTGGSSIWTFYVPATTASPIIINFTIPLRSTVGKALYFKATTTAASVYVNAQGYQKLPMTVTVT